MKGDYTRDTFRPELDFEDVRLQQGRVHLDSDWNERGDILRFLRETSLIDVIGHSGVPLEAEDSFEVFIDPVDENLKVRPGRMWVEGILCREDELVDLGPPPSSGHHLVYLETWRRLVTAVEDPYIREVALGGPDTAVREQVICRIRIVELGDDELCPDLVDWIPEGETDGTLTAQAVPPASGDDPCPVPSQAGYTGLENHLYRVQIHDSGDTASGSLPTFKWCRNNGSILTEWLDRDARVLEVKSLGRDRVGGFHDAEWVELGHDELDLEGEPGPLVELEGNPVESDGGGLLTVTTGSEALLFDPPTDQHPKVRRWDSGPIEITPGTTVDLENNIQVQFSEGNYRAGDYWLIPARAFIGEFHGSIEWPVESGSAAALPPHGVDRRYARLGVLWHDGSGNPEIDDCRDKFPPLTELSAGCCTVVVQPGESIQAAIDSLPDDGGCVCLKTGVHNVSEAVRIDRSNVVLHGESPGTVVRRHDDVLLLQLKADSGHVEDVIVRGIDFRFEPGEITSPEVPLLADLDDCERCVVEDCGFTGDPDVWSFGIRIAGSRDLTIRRCSVEPVVYGIWVDTDSTLLTIHDNVLRGVELEQLEAGLIGIYLEDAYGPSSIERNRIDRFYQGIVLNSAPPGDRPRSIASGSLIRGNKIDAEGPDGPGEETKLFVVDVGAWNCRVEDNRINYDSALFGGIRVSGPNGRVERNTLSCDMGSLPEENPAVGVLLGFSAEDPGISGRNGVVTGNRFTGPHDAIRIEGVRGATVAENLIEQGDDVARNAITLNGCSECRVTGNRLTGYLHGIVMGNGSKNDIVGNQLQTGGTGISALSEAGLTIADNRLDDVAQWGVLGTLSADKALLHANRIRNCSHTPNPLLDAIGIAVVGHMGELQIESCEVVDTGVSSDGSSLAQPAVGILSALVLQCRIQGNLVSYTSFEGRDLSAEDRAIQLQGLLEVAIGDTVVLGFCAQVLGNKFIGTGATALVEFLQQQPSDSVFYRFERVTFNDNYCYHAVEPAGNADATVLLRGRSGIAMGNHIKASTRVLAVRFDKMRGIFIGNDTQTGTNIDFPSPENAFNH